MMNSCKTSQAGFTILELAVVIIIVGMLVAGMMSGYQLYLQEQVANKQEENLDVVRAALASASSTGISNTLGIDLNNDGDFDDAGETDFDNSGPNAINAPAGVVARNGETYFYAPTLPHNQILNGYSFPCPAPLNVNISDATSGQSYSDGTIPANMNLPTALENQIPNGEASDCDSTSLSIGWNAGQGLYRVAGQNGGDVIIGAIPYDTLGISHKRIYWNNSRRTHKTRH